MVHPGILTTTELSISGEGFDFVCPILSDVKIECRLFSMTGSPKVGNLSSRRASGKDPSFPALNTVSDSFQASSSHLIF